MARSTKDIGKKGTGKLSQHVTRVHCICRRTLTVLYFSCLPGMEMEFYELLMAIHTKATLFTIVVTGGVSTSMKMGTFMKEILARTNGTAR